MLRNSGQHALGSTMIDQLLTILLKSEAFPIRNGGREGMGVLGVDLNRERRIAKGSAI